MITYGRSSVYALLGDRIVYRNLAPPDPRLPSLPEMRSRFELPPGVTPRKNELAYARVIVHLLQEARALEVPGRPIRQLVYLGDTRLNDGTAFANICRAGNWPGLAFIGSEQDGPARNEVVEGEHGTLYLANRWVALADFGRFCRGRGCYPDECTAVLVDLDKTLLGARGRNDHVIDQARVEAVCRTVGDLLGDGFDPPALRAAYDQLNRVQLHPFTADNQDYVAYICLILGSGLCTLESLLDHVRAGQLTGFGQFIDQVDQRAVELPASLRRIHQEVYACVRRGDPTPFKLFRRHEYRATVERMGQVADDATPAELLDQEITITQEVRSFALEWRQQGALLFGLSDKPEDASMPPSDLAAQGYRPIHRAETHVVGN